MHALRIDLHILGLIREFKHSNSNMRQKYTRMKSYWPFTVIKTDKMLSDVLDPTIVVNAKTEVSCL